jgi:hypothetical protein
MIRAARRNPADRVLDLLELGGLNDALPAKNQARTRGGDRYSRKAVIRGRAAPSIAETLGSEDRFAIPRLVLVDDFLTSGSTLRASAGAAREALAKLGRFGGLHARLDVFVLGFRPALFADGHG